MNNTNNELPDNVKENIKGVTSFISATTKFVADITNIAIENTVVGGYKTCKFIKQKINEKRNKTEPDTTAEPKEEEKLDEFKKD